MTRPALTLPDWRLIASCRGRTHVMFGDDPTEARQLCAGCPVRVECLTDTVTLPDVPTEGVWAGTNSRRHRQTLARAWRYRHHDRPYPVDPDCPWSTAVAFHFSALDVTAGAVPDHLLDLDAGHTPTRAPAPPPADTVCDRCGDPIDRPRSVADRNGPNATCGHASTYSRGCSCRSCTLAHAERRAAERAAAATSARPRAPFSETRALAHPERPHR